MEVPTFEAKNRLSALLAEVARGVEVTITKRGVPVAKLVRPRPASTGRRRGGPRPACARRAAASPSAGSGSRTWWTKVARELRARQLGGARLVLRSEQTPAVMALLDRVAETGAVAPLLWPLEALNGLLSAERRRRLGPAQRATLAAFLRGLPIMLDGRTAEQAWEATTHLAERSS